MVPDWESLSSSVDKQLWALTVCQTWGGQDGHFLWVLSFRTASLVSLGRRKQSILMALEKLSCPDQSSPDLLLNCRKEHKACRKSFFFFFLTKPAFQNLLCSCCRTQNHIFGCQRLNMKSPLLTFLLGKSYPLLSAQGPQRVVCLSD